MNWLLAWLREFWGLLAESGLWLIAGFLLAGLVHAFVPLTWVARHLSGRGLRPVLKAALLGIPLPLCSCSVVPAAASLRRRGASRGATAAFAISTPETGEESIALTWGLLGPIMALVRPLAALVTAVFAGLLIDAQDNGTPAPPPSGGGPTPECCGGACGGVEAAGASPSPMRLPGIGARLLEGLRYALVDLPVDLAPWLLAGLALSAAIAAAVPDDWITANVGTGMVPMLIMLVVGLPTYVCATASTPLAAVLVAKGLSPGAALVFLLAGPATNMATMAWVVRDLGWRALWTYIGAIAAVALLAGLALDALVPAGWIAGRAQDPGVHAHDGEGVWAAALGVMLAYAAVVRLARWSRKLQGRQRRLAQ